MNVTGAELQEACSVTRCGRKVRRRGLCDAHYVRLRKYGDSLGGPTERGAAIAWVKLALACDTDECLIWPFAIHDTGCGYVRIPGTRRSTAPHRLICTQMHGPRPASKQAAHSCGEYLCVNWRHLSWKTPVENAADKEVHGTVTRGERHGQHKLTAAQVLELRARYAAGETGKQLAQEYGISFSLAYQIIRREFWSWL